MRDLFFVIFCVSSSAYSISGHLDWTYMGCFVDNKSRILKTQLNVASLTNEKCIQACGVLGYLYAGTQYTNQCYCGNTEPSTHLLVSEGQCNRACEGDSSQKCGGTWRMSVYKYDPLSTSTPRTEIVTTKKDTETSSMTTEMLSLKTDADSLTKVTETTAKYTDTTARNTDISKTDSDFTTTSATNTYTSNLRSTAYPFCCCASHAVNVTSHDLTNKLEELKKKLKVQRKETSQFKAKKVCATDNRPSATYTGIILGASILISLGVVIVVSDIACLFSKDYYKY